MSTTTKLGIKVYTGLGRTGGPPPPGNWWDMEKRRQLALKLNNNDSSLYVTNVLSKRMNQGDKFVAQQIKKLEDGKLSMDDLLDSLEIDLSGVDATGNNLKREKKIGAVTTPDKINVRTSSRYGGAIQTALNCTHDGCKQYVQRIMDLLKDREDVQVSGLGAGKNDKSKYGLDAMPEKVKFYTRILRSQGGVPGIVAIFNNDQYRTNTTSHIRHVEILSGIMFEAGNVYCGNYGKAATSMKEAEVTVHNVRQVAGIAKVHPITQTDWRNLITLLIATDVHIKTFQCTPMATRAFTGSAHDVSGTFNIGY